MEKIEYGGNGYFNDLINMVAIISVMSSASKMIERGELEGPFICNDEMHAAAKWLHDRGFRPTQHEVDVVMGVSQQVADEDGLDE